MPFNADTYHANKRGNLMTHTYVKLPLSKAAFDEISAKLREAGYDHAFHAEEDAIDLHGLAACLDLQTSTTAENAPDGGEVRELVEALRELRKAFVSAWGYEPGPENTLYYPTLQRVDAALAKIIRRSSLRGK